MIRQSEIQGGIENSSQIFEYDDEGDIIDEKLFISGSLYEHTSLIKTDSGYIRTMTQDNEEVERLEQNKDGDNWNNRFYRFDELLESQEYTFDTKKLIHHSDRGFQYCSDDYQDELKTKKIKCSMTETYDPYANAVAERINGIPKQEFLGENSKRSLTVTKEIVRQSIDIYNVKRPHYSCYMNTPEQTHKQQKIKIRTYKSKRLRKNVLSES